MDPLATDQTEKLISLYHALALGWRRVTEAEATQITNKERWKGQAPSVEMAFRGLRVRIGIHSGGLRLVDISANGTSGRVGYRGYALAMAKAVEASAHGGQGRLGYALALKSNIRRPCPWGSGEACYGGMLVVSIQGAMELPWPWKGQSVSATPWGSVELVIGVCWVVPSGGYGSYALALEKAVEASAHGGQGAMELSPGLEKGSRGRLPWGSVTVLGVVGFGHFRGRWELTPWPCEKAVVASAPGVRYLFIGGFGLSLQGALWSLALAVERQSGLLPMGHVSLVLGAVGGYGSYALALEKAVEASAHGGQGAMGSTPGLEKAVEALCPWGHVAVIGVCWLSLQGYDYSLAWEKAVEPLPMLSGGPMGADALALEKIPSLFPWVASRAWLLGPVGLSPSGSMELTPGLGKVSRGLCPWGSGAMGATPGRPLEKAVEAIFPGVGGYGSYALALEKAVEPCHGVSDLLWSLGWSLSRGRWGARLALEKAVEASAHGGQGAMGATPWPWKRQSRPLPMGSGAFEPGDVCPIGCAFLAQQAPCPVHWRPYRERISAAQNYGQETYRQYNVYVPGSPKPPTGGQQATPPALGGLALPPPISTSWPTTGYSLGSLLPNSAVKRESRLRKTSAPDPQPTVVVDKREFNRRSSPEWAITSPYSSGQGNCVNLVSPKTPEKLPNVVDMSEASRALMQVGVTTEDSNTQVSLYVALIPSLLCRLAFLPPVPRTPIQLSPRTLEAPIGQAAIVFMTFLSPGTLEAPIGQAAVVLVTFLSPGTLEAPIGQAAIVFMTVAGSKTLMAFDSELMKESIALAQLCVTKVCVTKELKQKSTLQYPAFMAEMSDEGLFLAAFSRSLDAISWALACMEGMKRLPWRTKLLAHEQFEAITASELTADGQVVDRLIMRGLRLKAGVAWGPVHHNICVTTGRMAYRGRVMNRSARVMAMASSAEVLCTGAAYTQVLNSQRLRGHYKGCALCGNIRATQKGVFDLKGIRDPVTIYRCLKDWPTRLGSDSYPAVLGPIAIPIRSPTHLSQPDVGEIGVYESSGNLDRKTSSTSNKCLHHHECPHELQGSRQSLESSKQSQKISAFAPPGDPSMDEFNLHVMVMRANYEESDPAYPYAPNSEYSEGTQSPGAKAVALAPSVGSPRLPTLGLDVSGRHESRSGKLRLDVSGKHESQSGKLRLDGSGRHESRSGTYDHLISPELSLPPALNPGECSTQHFMGRTAGLPMLASSHSVGCVHKKSFLLPLGAKELDGGPGGSSGVARVANAKSSLGLDASLGPPRREDCVAEQMCSHQTFTLTEGAHDDLIEGTHDGGNSSEDEAQSEELFHSGGIRGETAGGRDSRKSPRNRLLNNLLPTMSRVISKRFGKGDGGNEEPVRGRSNNKKEGSSNIGQVYAK
eukprot:gene20585-27382_t